MSIRTEEFLKGLVKALDRINSGEDFDRVAMEEFDKIQSKDKTKKENGPLQQSFDALDKGLQKLLNNPDNCTCPGCYAITSLQKYASSNLLPEEVVEARNRAARGLKKEKQEGSIDFIKSKKEIYTVELSRNLLFLKNVFKETMFDYIQYTALNEILSENTNEQKGE